jgi:hypothetical protein
MHAQPAPADILRPGQLAEIEAQKAKRREEIRLAGAEKQKDTKVPHKGHTENRPMHLARAIEVRESECHSHVW